MTGHGRFGELSLISGMAEEEVSVEWRIPNFFSLPTEDKDWINSPTFRFRNETWHFYMFPDFKGRKVGQARRLRGLLGIARCPGCPPETFHFSVGTKGSRGVEKDREGLKTFCGSDDYHSWDDVCLRSDLRKRRNRLVPDGILTITCVIKRPAYARGQRSSDECTICYEKPVDCALYRCGHMCMCYDCALIISKSSAQCPICRNSIQDVLKIYKTF